MTIPTDFQAAIDSGIYKELYAEGGGRRTGGTDQYGRYETMSFVIPWDERSNFQDLLLAPSKSSGVVDGTWIRKTPFKHPDYQNLYASTIQWDPEGEHFPTYSDPAEFPARFGQARCHVDFRPPNFTFSSADDPDGSNSFGETDQERDGLLWATQELKCSAQWIPIANTSCKFVSDNKKILTPFSRRMTVLELSITWHKYPLQPLRRIRSFADKINLNTFLGCPPLTLMFLGVDSQREYTVDGNAAQKVNMRFKYRPVSWNKMARPDKLVFETVSDGLGNLLYEAVDFLPILLYGQSA